MTKPKINQIQFSNNNIDMRIYITNIYSTPTDSFQNLFSFWSNLTSPYN